MAVATHTLIDRRASFRRANDLWRLPATGTGFFFFGLRGRCLRLVAQPSLAALPGDALMRRRRARAAKYPQGTRRTGDHAVFIKVMPTTLTKAEPWYSIPARHFQVLWRPGEDIAPERVTAEAPLPIAWRRLNDPLHHLVLKELVLP